MKRPLMILDFVFRVFIIKAVLFAAGPLVVLNSFYFVFLVHNCTVH
jgi:hypothetical protein